MEKFKYWNKKNLYLKFYTYPFDIIYVNARFRYVLRINFPQFFTNFLPIFFYFFLPFFTFFYLFWPRPINYFFFLLFFTNYFTFFYLYLLLIRTALLNFYFFEKFKKKKNLPKFTTKKAKSWTFSTLRKIE